MNEANEASGNSKNWVVRFPIPSTYPPFRRFTFSLKNFAFSLKKFALESAAGALSEDFEFQWIPDDCSKAATSYRYNQAQVEPARFPNRY